jgi:pimeloyl-ACP methyl ester carboxylesterase
VQTAARSVRSGDGAELRFEVAGGDGPPVVLLHGSLAGPSVFGKLTPWLVDDHRLVLTTLRGHGGAEPTVPGDYGIAPTGVDDLLAVLDAEGIERAHVVGHSTGGSIALAAALRHPDRVDHLVLIEPTILSLLRGPEADRVRTEFDPVLAAGARGDDRAALRGLLDVVGGVAWNRLTEDARLRVVESLAPMAGLAAPHVRALLGLRVSAEDVVSLAAPCFLVYGTETIFFEAPISAGFRELRPDIPQLHVDGAGHNVHAARPDVVGPAVVEFLRAATGAP